MTNIPVDPTPPTKATDPTLGVLSHAIAVGVGLVAGWLSTKASINLDDSTQTEIAVAVTTAVTTAVHWVQAKFNQVQKS